MGHMQRIMDHDLSCMRPRVSLSSLRWWGVVVQVHGTRKCLFGTPSDQCEQIQVAVASHATELPKRESDYKLEIAAFPLTATSGVSCYSAT